MITTPEFLDVLQSLKKRGYTNGKMASEILKIYDATKDEMEPTLKELVESKCAVYLYRELNKRIDCMLERVLPA